MFFMKLKLKLKKGAISRRGSNPIDSQNIIDIGCVYALTPPPPSNKQWVCSGVSGASQEIYLSLISKALFQTFGLESRVGFDCHRFVLCAFNAASISSVEADKYIPQVAGIILIKGGEPLWITHH
jgi:hypothetical protein